MPVETEIKIRLSESALSARQLLHQHGFGETGPRQLETDQAFDLPGGTLRFSDRLLRLRSAGGRWTVTYKGPAYDDPPGHPVHKSRQEIETEITDGRAFVQILAGLGYQPSFAYEKFRTNFRIPGEPGIVTLDETPMGDFLELEGPGYWIDETAKRLGFGPAEYITLSYAALYQQYRQKHPTVPKDMKFHAT
jgi:adenylate cyclase class 2